MQRVGLLVAGASILLAGIYFFSGEAGLSGVADADELISAAYEMRVAHPPGYGLLTLPTGVLMRFLPMTPVRVGLLMAAVSAGLVVGLTGFMVWLVVGRLGEVTKRRRWLAVGTAMVLVGTSPLFWFYGQVLEVMNLGSVLVLMTVILLLLAVELRDRRMGAAAGATLGLMLSYHHLLWLLLPMVGLLAYGVWGRDMWAWMKWMAVTVTVFLAAVALPYSFHLREQTYTYAFELGEGLHGWWDYWSRSMYSGIQVESGEELRAFWTPVAVGTMFENVRNNYGGYLGWQVGWGLLLMALLGGVLVWKRRDYVTLGFYWWGLVYGVGLAAYLEAPPGYSIDESLLAWGLHERMFMFALPVLGIWAGLAVGSMSKWRGNKRGWLVMGLLGWLWMAQWRYLASPIDQTQTYGMALKAAQLDAVIYCDDDYWCFGLLAHQTMYQERMNVTVRPLSSLLNVGNDRVKTVYWDAPFFVLEHMGRSILDERQVYFSRPIPYYAEFLGAMGKGENWGLNGAGYTMGCDENVEHRTNPVRMTLTHQSWLDYQAWDREKRSINRCVGWPAIDCTQAGCEWYAALEEWMKNPDEAEVHERLGDIYLKEGFETLALREFEIAYYLEENERLEPVLEELRFRIPENERLVWSRINAGEYRNRQ